MKKVVKNKKNFLLGLLVVVIILSLLVAFVYYRHSKAINISLYDSSSKMKIGYIYRFSALEEKETPIIDENKEEIEDLFNKIKAIASQTPVSYSSLEDSQTLADFSFEFNNGDKIRMSICNCSVINNKNSKETQLLLYFNKKYYPSVDLQYVLGSISQVSLRAVTLDLLNSAPKVTVYYDRLNEIQAYKEHEVTKDEREKLIDALKEAKTSPLFGGPDAIASGKAPPCPPFYSIEIKKDDLTVNINWLEENYDYLSITFEKSDKVINTDETSMTLYQPDHSLFNVCKDLLPLETVDLKDLNYFFSADSAKVTKENMGLNNFQISRSEINCILETILRKDLSPVEATDDVPMIIEFEIKGKKEIMKIGEDYVEYLGKRVYKPYILFYVVHCLR
jgi:hypothetical protein